MDTEISKFVNHCKICQRFKKKKKKIYDKIPPENADLIPWKNVYIELVDPYSVTGQKSNDRNFKTITVIDLAIGWFEIADIPLMSQFFFGSYLIGLPIHNATNTFISR